MTCLRFCAAHHTMYYRYVHVGLRSIPESILAGAKAKITRQRGRLLPHKQMVSVAMAKSKSNVLVVQRSAKPET